MKKIILALFTFLPTLPRTAIGQSDSGLEEKNAQTTQGPVELKKSVQNTENNSSHTAAEEQKKLINNEASQNESKPDPTLALKTELDGSAKNYYASSPEGKTLPKGVLRVRMPLRFANAHEGYDNKGKKTDIGLGLRAIVSALVLEYGVNDDISFQFLMPIVFSNKMGLDGNKFRKSNDYKTNYSDVINQAAAILLKNGECNDTESCRSLILSQVSPALAKVTTPITLPNGETLTVNAGVALKDAADSFVVNAIKPHSGKTGIGDIEMGLLWSAISEKSPILNVPIYYSIGAGIRIPTGSFKNVPTPGYRGTSRGVFEGAIRQNLDYNPLEGVVFSWQNQTEKSLAKSKYREASLLDSSQLNKVNTQEMTYERRGFRNVGFLKTSWGLGNISQTINMLGLYSYFKYDIDSAEYKNGVAASLGRKQAYSTVIGTTIDLLSRKIPVQFDVDYEVPLYGKNNRLATNIIGLNLKVFYKF